MVMVTRMVITILIMMMLMMINVREEEIKRSHEMGFRLTG
jgi:hypothetical protein